MAAGKYIRTLAHKQKQREAHLGQKGRPATPEFLTMIKKPKSVETKRKMSEVKKTSEHNKKVSDSLKGKTKSQEHKNKISNTLKRLYSDPSNHPMWLGETHPRDYPTVFNKTLKLRIRARDNFVCCLCGKTELEEMLEFNKVLSVNHIDYDKYNCSEENLNTLCLRCNFRVNVNREFWTNFFRDGP